MLLIVYFIDSQDIDIKEYILKGIMCIIYIMNTPILPPFEFRTQLDYDREMFNRLQTKLHPIMVNKKVDEIFEEIAKVPKEDRTINIFTFRITPYTTKTCPYEAQEGMMHAFCALLGETKKLFKIMCFRETKPKLHFHFRVVTDYKTPKSIQDLIKKQFPHLKGNRDFSTHKCRVNGILYDKTIQLSIYYTMKGGDEFYVAGYSEEELLLLQKETDKYQTKLKNTTIADLIINKYDLDSTSGDISHAIIKYYMEKKKVPPLLHIVRRLLHQIKYKVSAVYRQQYIDQVREELAILEAGDCKRIFDPKASIIYQ